MPVPKRRDHADATTIHMGAYVQSVDPGAIGPLKLWVDLSEDPPVLRWRNEANTGWDGPIGGAGGGTEVELLVNGESKGVVESIDVRGPILWEAPNRLRFPRYAVMTAGPDGSPAIVFSGNEVVMVEVYE